MRTLLDAAGRVWDVAVGDGSYGNVHLIFAVRGANDIRMRLLEQSSRFEAEQMLLRLSAAELEALLARAEKWPTE